MNEKFSTPNTRGPARGHSRESVFTKDQSHALTTPADFDALIAAIGDSRIVMLGEATHGTHEYYIWRAILSRRLIVEKGFNFISVEGDWPDCYRLNRYIKNYTDAGGSSRDVLRQFDRWPTWMWANWEIAALSDWLYSYNRKLPVQKKAGFYGLDVYSLWESMEEIINYLNRVDPGALAVAKKAFQCFEPFRSDEGMGYAESSLLVPRACTQEVVDLLLEIQRRLPQYNTDHETVFSTEQNALVAYHAEKYYRAMLHGGNQTWNIRDTHMMETLDRLLVFHGTHSKAIVWAHNTHIGDARATDMQAAGMHNIGELARKRHGDGNVFLVGFGSYEGTTIAARRWGEPAERMKVPQARDGSWEDVLRKSGMENGYVLKDTLKQASILERKIGHRAIGVVYDPRSEKHNYVPSLIPARYDAFIFFKETNALHSLHVQPDGNQMPETYPFGV